MHLRARRKNPPGPRQSRPNCAGRRQLRSQRSI
jgi:hypothetical protein